MTKNIINKFEEKETDYPYFPDKSIYYKIDKILKILICFSVFLAVIFTGLWLLQ